MNWTKYHASHCCWWSNGRNRYRHFLTSAWMTRWHFCATITFSNVCLDYFTQKLCTTTSDFDAGISFTRHNSSLSIQQHVHESKYRSSAWRQWICCIQTKVSYYLDQNVHISSNITPRVLDEIVWPMRQLNMREEEFVSLKALAFLHPGAIPQVYLYNSILVLL
jgi:hypothetical protein